MDLTVGEILGLVLQAIVQYGLPSVAVCVLAWASWTGKIYWPPTVEAIKQQVKDAQADAERQRLEREMYREELLETRRTAEKAANVTERIVEKVARR